MLILSLPVSITIALAIKLEGTGPIFYRQERWGKAGKRFRAYKFRTMVPNSDEDFGIVQAKEDDPRTTKVGKVLRTMGLDELPQIINIFLGHMSFVGPRPERDHFVKQLEEIIPYYGVRFSVKPGVTGWAQVSYGYGASVEDAMEKLNYDLFYIKNMSIYMDLMIVVKTIKIVVFGKGAR